MSTLWRVLGVSVAGSSHEQAGFPCDDAHVCNQLEDGSLLLAVADGAGSASQSARGAAYVVQSADDLVTSTFSQQAVPINNAEWREWLQRILQSVHTGLEELATKLYISSENEAIHPPVNVSTSTPPLHEFATTFLFTVITSQWIVALQIGDGAIVVQYADGTLEALTQPDHGEFLNETSFITDSNYLDHTQYIILPQEHRPIQNIAIFSDGLQMLALDFTTTMPYEPFFTPLFQFMHKEEAKAEALQNFLRSERVCARTGDDKTLVLAVRQ